MSKDREDILIEVIESLLEEIKRLKEEEGQFVPASPPQPWPTGPYPYPVPPTPVSPWPTIPPWESPWICERTTPYTTATGTGTIEGTKIPFRIWY